VARIYFVTLLAVGTLLGVLNVRNSGTTARAQENNPELPTVTQPSAAKGTDQATVLALKEGQPPLEGPWGLKKAVVLNASLPRVLLIGDSIVGGYGKRVALRLKGKANVDIWETPQWLNAALDSEVQDILKSNHYDVIHFNESGLHAWAPGRVPEGQYGPLMLKYLATLQKSAPQTKLVWASTTPITVLGHPTELDDLDKVVSDRNAVCTAIMKDHQIVIDDLYAVMVTKLTLAAGDRFHWNNEGFDLLAETVTNALLPLLENKGQIRSSAPPK
jgi:hypothetical protein